MAGSCWWVRAGRPGLHRLRKNSEWAAKWPKLGDGKPLANPRGSFLGHPGAIHFSRFLKNRVFPQPVQPRHQTSPKSRGLQALRYAFSSAIVPHFAFIRRCLASEQNKPYYPHLPDETILNSRSCRSAAVLSRVAEAESCALPCLPQSAIPAPLGIFRQAGRDSVCNLARQPADGAPSLEKGEIHGNNQTR